jgi:acetyl-CoA acyltransferase
VRTPLQRQGPGFGPAPRWSHHCREQPQISDGTAALLLTTSEPAAAHGLKPLARVHTVALAAVSPMPMLDGPIPATAKALSRSGLSIGDFGTFEVNEALAPGPLAWLAETGADDKALNPSAAPSLSGTPWRRVRRATHDHARPPHA